MNVCRGRTGGKGRRFARRGDLSLRNLRPGDFKPDGRRPSPRRQGVTEQSSLGVYGDLFVEIGPGPLHFTGEIENSLLKGSVSIGILHSFFRRPSRPSWMNPRNRSAPVRQRHAQGGKETRALRHCPVFRRHARERCTAGTAAGGNQFVHGRAPLRSRYPRRGGNTEIRHDFQPHDE